MVLLNLLVYICRYTDRFKMTFWEPTKNSRWRFSIRQPNNRNDFPLLNKTLRKNELGKKKSPISLSASKMKSDPELQLLKYRFFRSYDLDGGFQGFSRFPSFRYPAPLFSPPRVFWSRRAFFCFLSFFQISAVVIFDAPHKTTFWKESIIY